MVASVLCSTEGLGSVEGARPSPLITSALRTFAEIETAHGLCQAEGFQVELIRSVELALDVGVTGQDLQEGGRFYREFRRAMEASDRARRQKGPAAYCSEMAAGYPSLVDEIAVGVVKRILERVMTTAFSALLPDAPTMGLVEAHAGPTWATAKG